MSSINNKNIRIRTIKKDGIVCLKMDVRQGKNAWQTALSNGIVGGLNWVAPSEKPFFSDPILEWKTGDEHTKMQFARGVFTRAAASNKGLTLTGKKGCHNLTMTMKLVAPNRIHVTVNDKLDHSAGAVFIGRLMSRFFLIPDDRADGSAEPLDFRWLPSLHFRPEGVSGDNFFRSPAAIVYSHNLYAAIVPDLDIFAQNYALPHALDMRVFDRVPLPETIEAPSISYGVCPYGFDAHVYTSHDPDQIVPARKPEVNYAFHLFLGRAETKHEVSQTITSFLWDTYGRRYFRDIRPQVLPFEEYGRRYTYVHELPRSIKTAVINKKKCVGINNEGRHGANFHAWENDLHVGFGVKHYAEKWSHKKLLDMADGMLQLSMQAPIKQGAFPCIYNFATKRYEGSLIWTARAADPINGYDTAAMGVSTWWRLYWRDHYSVSKSVLNSVIAYARFLKAQQLPSGAIPTYFFKDLTAAKQLKESATTAISGAVLAKVALITRDKSFKRSALATGQYIVDQVMPTLFFNDFENFYSCCPTPLHAVDYWSGIWSHNTMSMQWACDQMLALYKLTHDEQWLKHGEYLMSVLSLYHQVWDPAHRSGYLYGGFAAMNTDGEWNDGRQARFVSTYADYYLQTGQVEYLERAVAACRASFALMDMKENHENDINQAVLGDKLLADTAAQCRPEAGQGYAGENIHHTGENNHICGWSGMNWSSAGGLAASAYLERIFGAVWVDVASKSVTPIDGTKASVVKWDKNSIALEIDSALSRLPSPYTEERDIKVKFGNMLGKRYTVNINGAVFPNQTRAKLEQGLTIRI